MFIFAPKRANPNVNKTRKETKFTLHPFSVLLSTSNVYLLICRDCRGRKPVRTAGNPKQQCKDANLLPILLSGSKRIH
jgi:hypothetical protein